MSLKKDEPIDQKRPFCQKRKDFIGDYSNY